MSETVYQISPDYQLSTDYPLMAKLAREHSIICVVDYNSELRDVAHTLWSPPSHGQSEFFQVSARGYGYLDAYGEEEFVRQCASANLEFVQPVVTTNPLTPVPPKRIVPA